VRTLVTFRSDAFNTSATKDSFVNADNYGDDVASWLMAELKTRGITTDAEPRQEDFGWYFNFRAGGADHCLLLGYRPGEGDDAVWLGWVERAAGFFGSILGRRRKGIRPEAVDAIHRVLSSSPKVSAVRWHEQADFDAGNEERGSPSP
jgi:hypothetical protein